MSSNLNYKQVANVERRTWDRDEYEKKAQARAQDEPKAGDKRPLLSSNEEKEEFRPAAPGAAGPERSKRAFLKARQEKVVDIDSKVGSTEIVSAEAVAKTKLHVSIKVCLLLYCNISFACMHVHYAYIPCVSFLFFHADILCFVLNQGWSDKDGSGLALQGLRLLSEGFAYLS